MAIATESKFFFEEDRHKIFKFAGFLQKLAEFSNKLRLNDLIRSIDCILKKIETGTFSVAVCGEMQTGKSTLFNAILGAEVIPVRTETAAKIVRSIYDVDLAVEIIFQDRSEKNITLEQLTEYLGNSGDRTENIAANIAEIIVRYPFRYGRDDLEILDLPGINSDCQWEEMGHSILDRSNLLIFVLTAESLLSENACNFLENSLLTQDLGRIVFVITGSDRLSDVESANNLVKSFKVCLQQQIIAKLAAKYGRDSLEYSACLAKIGQLNVFCLSATNALKAKIDRDEELLVTSRFGEFEKTLDRLLKQEKGLIFWQVAINQTLAAANDIVRAIAQQDAHLVVQQEQLQATYEQPLAELKISRQNRRENVHKLRHFQELDKIQQQILDLRAKWEREKTMLEIERNRLQEMLTETEAIMRESQIEAERIVNLIGIFCHQCGKMSKPNANFCIACGTQLNCHKCGKKIVTKIDTCPSCGTEIS
jgi:hypothetical protein